MILSAQTIRKRLAKGDLVISPFHTRTAVNGRSFGLSSCGYDVRLAEDFILWPYIGVLASIQEYIRIPDDLCAEVKDKSTNARLFVFVQNTVIEPGWNGYLTLEMTRDYPWPIRMRAGTPIAQIIFKQLDEPTEQPYRGKYQDQLPGAQPAILKNIT